MPAEQEIVHWYNQIPSVENGFIAEDDPSITDYSDMVNRSFHDDYTADRITKLRDLLDRLCNDIGSITYNITYDVVNIVARGLPNDTTFSFSLQQWLTDEREVKRYLREWFPSFNIPYTMGGIANHIAPNPVIGNRTTDAFLHVNIMGLLNSIRVYYPNNDYSYVEGVYRIGSCSFTASEYRVNKVVLHNTLRLMFPSASNVFELIDRVDSASTSTPTVESIRRYMDTAILTPITNNYEDTRIIPIEPHPRNPFNDRIVETLTQVATGLDTQLHYAITDTHVTIEDRSFNPVHTLSLRLDVFEARALPILEISRRIQRERESRRNTASPYQFEFPRRDNGYSEGRRRLPLNPTPNMAIRPLDDSTNPSTCNGKEEAPYTNYLDVI